MCDAIIFFLGTVQTIDHILESNLKLAAQFRDALPDQGNHELLIPFGIGKCHLQDTRYCDYWHFVCCPNFADTLFNYADGRIAAFVWK